MFDLHTPPANSIVRIKQRQSILSQRPIIADTQNSTSKPNTPTSSSNTSTSRKSTSNSSTPINDNNNSQTDEALSPAVTMRNRNRYKNRY